MSEGKLLFKLTEHITGFRVLSVSPPVEEVTGENSGKIRSVKVRTIWTYKSFIGRRARDRVEGRGIIFSENGATITYTVNGYGELLTNFGYRVRGTIKFRAHSRRPADRLGFLHGTSGHFESVGRGKFVTKAWLG